MGSDWCSVVACILVVCITSLHLSVVSGENGDKKWMGNDYEEQERGAFLSIAKIQHRIPLRNVIEIKSESNYQAIDNKSLYPGLQINGGFSLPTFDGTFQYPISSNESFSSNSSSSLQPTILFHFYNVDSLSQIALWNNQSLRHLLIHSPNNTILIFGSTSATSISQAILDSEWMRSILIPTMSHIIDGPNQPISPFKWQHNIHFLSVPVSDLVTSSSAEISEYDENDFNIGDLAFNSNWTSGITQIVVPWLPGPPIARLDGSWPFIFATFPTQDVQLLLLGEGCNGSKSLANVTGKIALVASSSRSSSRCHHFDQIFNAQLQNASGVVVIAREGEAISALNCYNEASCDIEITIPATMISYEDGLLLQSLLSTEDGSSISVRFVTSPGPSSGFLLDPFRRIQSLGYIQYPDFQFYSWAAQGAVFESQLLTYLEEEVEEEEDLIIINVFNNEPVTGPGFISSNITLPDDPKVLSFKFELELDTEISCESPLDSTCQPWDRIHSVTVCCGEDNLCNLELGRWINAFGRRGRWVTEITPLMPLFTSQECRFVYTTDGSTPYFYITLNLRFVPRSSSHKPFSSLLSSTSPLLSSLPSSATIPPPPFNQNDHPSSAIPLFIGGSFDQNYNNRTPIYFSVPQNTSRTLLVATITGHGSDNLNCAEFCVTSHHFLFNSHPNVRTFKNAGTALGCARETTKGVVPNEYGTWLYGRNGWCDGLQVDPWIVDVTAQLEGEGAMNNATYFGWYQGHTPNPEDGGAYIVMQSYLVFYSPDNNE